MNTKIKLMLHLFVWSYLIMPAIAQEANEAVELLVLITPSIVEPMALRPPVPTTGPPLR